MRNLFLLMLAAVSLLAVEPVVTGAWVEKHLGDKKLVIVDVSNADAYEEGHIPGAINSGIERWRKGVGKHAEVRSAQELQAEMRRLGITGDATVVVYSHHLDNKDMLRATYVLWAMEYAGAKNTALLDGGIKAYTAAGGTLSETEEADRKSGFSVRTHADMIAQIGEVKASLHKVPMIDSRPDCKEGVYSHANVRIGVSSRLPHSFMEAS
ncbi:MAG: rhodanese-like domain-containing protein [Campylobacterales bacterium]